MSNYQVIARKYRPRSFHEVLGQEAIVTTLKNAIRYRRLAHAYLFCGSRGTGKTTLARVFAKTLNCQNPTADSEPCNQCSSCKEITAGSSLDVLEIDGASHRGIDDIRQINETVGYATSSGKYKIYIIDEVHMLTKEAFNALLKTLEEPPPKVMFLFATTEPHKVLPTILSRCQRFNLNRIPLEKIIAKLRRIAQDLSISVEEEALHLLAQRADGGLRDAESLFDQIIAFHDGEISAKTVADVLGVMPKDSLFALDQAGKEGRLAFAFEIAHQLFSEGKDLLHFIDSLTEHFRLLLLIKLSGSNAPYLSIADSDKGRYESSAKLYTQEECLTLLDFLIEAQNQIRFQSSSKIALEAILLRILRIHQRLPVEYLVRRLAELEQSMASTSSDSPKPPLPPSPLPALPVAPVPYLPAVQHPSAEKPPFPPSPFGTTSEDPTPTPEDLGKAKAKEKQSLPPPQPKPLLPPSDMFSAKPSPAPAKPAPAAGTAPQAMGILQQSRYDTILQFAAVELEGTVQKKSTTTP